MTTSYPPDSPLSELTQVSSSNGDPFDEEEMPRAAGTPPPAKRQRTDGGGGGGGGSGGGGGGLEDEGDDRGPESPTLQGAQLELELASISSDSSGEIPAQASSIRFDDDDDEHDQVTACRWLGCDVGDLANRDVLVAHLHAAHIDNKTKHKYTCEWDDCTRRGSTHASAYALKGHVRAHTKEKPFQCALPECDRTFTRSDALFKHMRSVHESESWSTTDPIPRDMRHLGKGKFKHLKALEGPVKDSHTAEQTNGVAVFDHDKYRTTGLPAELGFTSEEESMEIDELYRLLRRQLHWAQQESEALKAKCDVLEEMRKSEWLDKEALFEQVICSEKDWRQRRQAVLAGFTIPISDVDVVPKREDSPVDTAMHDVSVADNLGGPLQQTQSGDQHEAAAALVSLHQT